MGDLTQLKMLVYDAIYARRAANQYVFNDFALKRGFLPFTALKDFPEKGQVYIVGLTGGDGPAVSRTNVAPRESPVQIGFQRQVDAQDETLLDNLCELVEQIRDTARLDVAVDSNDWRWVRNEPLLDENKTPFVFMGLREANLFEAYFTAYYQRIVT
jgi:hypothetical protein